MEPVSATPAHIMMQRRDQDRHQTEQSGPASAFATMAFGPMKLPDSNPVNRPEAEQEGAPATKNPLQAPSMAWVTTVQGLDSGTEGAKSGL